MSTISERLTESADERSNELADLQVVLMAQVAALRSALLRVIETGTAADDAAAKLNLASEALVSVANERRAYKWAALEASDARFKATVSLLTLREIK